jgi:hypothetical protein
MVCLCVGTLKEEKDDIYQADMHSRVCARVDRIRTPQATLHSEIILTV